MTRNLTIAGSILVLCLAIQYSSLLLSLAVPKVGTFKEIEGGVYEAKVTDLEEGDYYVSLGRPRSGATIRSGTQLVDTNLTSSGRRFKLLVGGIVSSRSLSSSTVRVSYENFRIGGGVSTHSPVITTLGWGILLQYWRAFTELLLGPFFSLVMMLVVMISYRTAQWTEKRYKVLFFTFAFFYTASLAHYTRPFFSSESCDVIHFILKQAFFFCFFLIVYGLTRKPLLSGLFVLSILSSVVVFFFNHELLIMMYQYQLIFLSLVSIYVAYSLIQRDRDNVLIILAIVLSVLQIVDTFIYTYDLNLPNLGPAFIVILSAYYLFSVRKVSIQTEMKMAKMKSTSDAALSVAHDIRSPLLSLRAMITTLDVNEDQKKVIDSAIFRLRGVASALLEREKKMCQLKVLIYLI